MGPLDGRSDEMLDEVAGLLLNPNCEVDLNFVPLRTLSLLVHQCEDYSPAAGLRQAIGEWLPWFYRRLEADGSWVENISCQAYQVRL